MFFIGCGSCNGSPQQIPLRQLPFSNVEKPHYHCRAFWAIFLSCLNSFLPLSKLVVSFSLNEHFNVNTWWFLQFQAIRLHTEVKYVVDYQNVLDISILPKFWRKNKLTVKGKVLHVKEKKENCVFLILFNPCLGRNCATFNVG